MQQMGQRPPATQGFSCDFLSLSLSLFCSFLVCLLGGEHPRAFFRGLTFVSHESMDEHEGKKRFADGKQSFSRTHKNTYIAELFGGFALSLIYGLGHSSNQGKFVS